MTFDEFKYNFNLLTNAFSVTKPDQKLEMYFKFLEKIPGNMFSNIVEVWVKSQPRFPTISDLLSAYLVNAPKIEKRSCGICDGFGTIKVGYKIYRAWCEHGNLPSSKIKQLKSFMINGELESQRIELEKDYGQETAKKLFPNVYNPPPPPPKDFHEVLTRSPEQCFKGILFLTGGDLSRVSRSPGSFKRFAESTMEFLGERRCKEIEASWRQKSNKLDLKLF